MIDVTESLKKSRYMQYISTLIATLSVASNSTYVTWSSPSLPKLTSNESPIGTKLSIEEASWVASIFLLSSIPGCLVSPFLVEKFGLKPSLMFSAALQFFPWLAVIYAESFVVLIVARFIAGLGGAIVMVAVPMYIGEVADKDIRGKLGTAVNILKLSGSLFVMSVGPFVSYTALNLSCSAFPLVFAVLFYFVPESPYYLIKVNNKNAARRNLIRLSSNNLEEKDIDSRLRAIEKTVEYDMQNKSTIWELFSKQEYRKSLIVMVGIKTLQQFSGMNAIDTYMLKIIGSTGSSITPEISSIICGFIQIPAALVAAALVDKMGRKPLMIISALGCAIALTGEGAYFYLQDVAKLNMDYLAWLPTTSLALFLIMNPIGCFTLPYVLLGEMFATNIKGLAVSALTLYGGALAFIVVKFFDPISEAWGMYTMFWIFAATCIMGSVFVFFVQPETKGKTFAEIQEKLKRNRRNTQNKGGVSVN